MCLDHLAPGSGTDLSGSCSCGSGGRIWLVEIEEEREAASNVETLESTD